MKVGIRSNNRAILSDRPWTVYRVVRLRQFEIGRGKWVGADVEVGYARLRL